MGPAKGKSRQKTVNVRHKTSGKELVIQDNPTNIKKYKRLGYTMWVGSRGKYESVNERMLNESLGDFLDRTLGDLDHVIISLAQEKHIDVKEFKMLQMYLVRVMRKFDVTLKKKAPRGWKGSHLKEISERILKEKYAGNLGKEVSKAVKNLKTIVLELKRLKYITGDEFRHHFHHYYVFYDRVFKNLLKGKGLDGY